MDMSDESVTPSGNSPTESNPPATGGVDNETLKRAMKAFKKRIKLQRLDDNSRLGVGALSGGEKGLVAVRPPDQYPQAVWEELARQGKIRSAGYGLYELATKKPD